MARRRRKFACPLQKGKRKPTCPLRKEMRKSAWHLDKDKITENQHKNMKEPPFI
jgi:hypothetical protein